jgi:hypothetical protein
MFINRLAKCVIFKVNCILYFFFCILGLGLILCKILTTLFLQSMVEACGLRKYHPIDPKFETC